MLKIKKEGVILKPTSRKFENLAVLNPAVIQEDKAVHIIYRAISKNFISCLGYAKLKGPTKIQYRWKVPLMYPKSRVEKKGIEDPRIVKIGDEYYMAYIAHDGKNAVIGYTHGKNLLRMKRGGIISPNIRYHKASKLMRSSKLKDDYYFFEAFYKEYSGKNVLVWHKDGFFFPEKFQGRFAFVHRVLPDVQIAMVRDLNELKSTDYWTSYLENLSKYVILEGVHGWEGRHIGGGAPPVKTKKGWLFIYHAAEESNRGRIYHAGAALYDLKNPKKLIARLPEPLFSPTEDYELKGHVNHVVFPTGTAQFNGKFYVYYGAADTYIAVASMNMDDLLDELMKNKLK